MFDIYVKRRIRFTLRDKRLFEIIEVEITRVDCTSSVPFFYFDRSCSNICPLRNGKNICVAIALCFNFKSPFCWTLFGMFDRLSCIRVKFKIPGLYLVCLIVYHVSE